MNISKKTVISKVLKAAGRYRYLLLFSLFLSAVCVFSQLYIPVLAGRAIDIIAAGKGMDFGKIKPELFSIGIFALVSGLFRWIIDVIINRVSFKTVRDLRNRALGRICILPLSYLDSTTAGDTVSRIISDADRLADGLIMGFSQLFTGLLTIGATLAFMIRVSPAITPVVAVLTPLSLFVARFTARHTHSMFTAQAKAQGRQAALVDEAVTNRRVISAYDAGEKFNEDFAAVNDEFAESSFKATFYSSITNPSTRFVNNMIYAAVALAGALSCITGSITVGGLSCFLSYAGQYAKPFNEISGVFAELQNAIACARRLFEIIDAQPEKPDSPGAESLENPQGEIRAENVCFSYTPGTKLIENLSFRAEKGMQVAIVGPTGCGKTTVINLLMRFYDADSGRITFDGSDITQIKRSSLRENCAMVLQETWLKTGTVRENIALGKPGADDEEIIRAAKSANAHRFIMKLPQGYDTVISDETGGLSQGQKQLLCIARVMLCLPPVLILDEATSSIDTRTEIKIRQAFESMTKGRTSFIVAHRLSTVRNSGLILVMNRGNIVEQGTHEELMNMHGFYEKLYNSRTV